MKSPRRFPSGMIFLLEFLKFMGNKIERYGLVVEPRKTRRRERAYRVVRERASTQYFDVLYNQTGVPEFYRKQDLPIFRNKQVKAREHLLTGAYIDVRDRNKAERNAEMRSL